MGSIPTRGIMLVEGWFDGSIGPKNPGGTAAWGYVIKTGPLTVKNSGLIGTGPTMTNNVAEVCGVIQLMECILRDFQQAQVVRIYGDSNLVIRQMNGQGRKFPGGHWAPYVKLAHEVVAELRARCPVRFQWIPRGENSEADQVADYRQF